LFDGFSLMPNLRPLLPEFEFTIDIPSEVIDQVNIDEVMEFLSPPRLHSKVCNPSAKK
jgi:hypothetical protein